MAGTVLLLILNDTVTRLTDYYGIVLGIVIPVLRHRPAQRFDGFRGRVVRAAARWRQGEREMTGSTKRVSVVTGGASGIGAACVRELAANGDLVIVVDRDIAKAQAVAAEIGGRAYPADVSDEQGVEACARRLNANAGRSMCWSTAPASFRCPHGRTICRCRHGMMSCAWISAAHMWPASPLRGHDRPQARRIVNIASIAGMRSMPLQCLRPGQAAVIAITECLAAEWGPSGLRVNAVSPGYIRSRQL